MVPLSLSGEQSLLLDFLRQFREDFQGVMSARLDEVEYQRSVSGPLQWPHAL